MKVRSSVYTYPIRRICRLRKHAQLLHRMYLNYRGRQAEDAICFSRHIQIDYCLGEKICKAKCLLSSKSNDNSDDKLHKHLWVVEVKDINTYLESIQKPSIVMQSELLYIEKSSQKIGNLTFRKKYEHNSKRHILIIE